MHPHARAQRGSVLRRVLPTIVTLAAVALFVAAGNWQRGRMHAKEALGAQLAAAQAAPVAPLPGGTVDWAAWRFRAVEARGTFDAPRQFLLDNRVHRGRVGYHVVTPLRLDDGRVVLIDRGWVAAGATRVECLRLDQSEPRGAQTDRPFSVVSHGSPERDAIVF